jgi:succinate dehydrogenase / fumarate reductase flavoprotein subunit
VGESGRGVYLDFADAIKRLGEDIVRERYGNLFDIYYDITNENAYRVPMRIFPAVHYTMGGLWVDYNLMSNVPGLFVLGEANFSDHGANRLGASALMQGLADGYFVIPYTIADYLATQSPGARPQTDAAEFAQAEENVRGIVRRLLEVKGREPVSHFHKRLGQILWDHCGMARNAAGLRKALQEIPPLREEFWSRGCGVNVPGDGGSLNQSLERAGRVADFLELAELMCLDAQRRALRPCRRLGMPGRRPAAAAQQRAARVRGHAHGPTKLQVTGEGESERECLSLTPSLHRYAGHFPSLTFTFPLTSHSS